MKFRYISVLAAGLFALSASAQTDSLWLAQRADIGGDKAFDRTQTTGAVSVITNDHVNHRSAKNIGNSILGEGGGLISLQSAGTYAAQNPTFYIRGLQTLNGNNTPMFVVDGIERDITSLSPEEVESVTILKDAVATALYGNKGINGVVAITTKRGHQGKGTITLTYDHTMDYLVNKPRFADAYTYANAMNEALANDGMAPRYDAAALDAFQNGTYPGMYANVDWVDRTFRSTGTTNRYTAEFQGGSQKFRYYTALSLLTNKGFVANANMNDDYSTQDKFTRGNLRMNLDIDLTPTTLLTANVYGSLTEASQPGSKANLWNMVYTVPSAAFPEKAEGGKWGGSDTWAGTLNPVAQATAASYYKNHTRTFFADMAIKQDLSGLLDGLGAKVRVAYDNISNIAENHSKTYMYTVTTPKFGADGQPAPTYKNYGADSAMGSGAKTDTYTRRLHFDLGLDYRHQFGDLDLYSQLKWEYEFEDPEAVNNTIYRQNISSWTHLAYKGRYLADVTLVGTGSSRLAPGSKWAFSPTLGLGWVVSNENFWNDKAGKFLKVRASFGRINTDFLPKDSWTYWAQAYALSGLTYPFTGSWTSGFGSIDFGRLATADCGREYGLKANIGIDYNPLPGLQLSADYYREMRRGIWVAAAGKYSAVLGRTAPFENAGKVDSQGFELSLDYTHTFGAVQVNIGGNLNYNTSKIKDMLEEPRLYDNLIQTGHRVSQAYGLIATGFFKDQADIDASPVQTFNTCRPGDIKYEDVNKDGVVDANDKVAIGYSTTAPELFYNLHLGLEYKGIGLYANFQGAGRYSAMLNTKSMYWPLMDNTNISQYAYDNRWTPATAETATLPRLSSQSNANNKQTSTQWLVDRSFFKLRDIELYYHLPACLLQKTRFVKAAKVYVRGIDLFSCDDIPEGQAEAYGTTPLTRSVALGVSVTL